ncbi:hypothetical protein DYB32_010504, partial [Aphanomyces invadans]
SVVVTKDVYRTFLILIDKVLPSIVAKWPCPDRNVKLQHDNARAHVTPFDATVLAAFANYSTAGWTFTIEPQPANGHDLQSLQHRTSARNVDELVANVEAAFVDYPSERLDRTFLTLQAGMIETLKCRGDNAYKVPHQAKEKQARQGRLPESLLCPLDVYESVKGELDLIMKLFYFFFQRRRSYLNGADRC